MWRRGMSILVAGLLLAGCSGYGELRAIVRAATPDDAERIGACQEYGVYGVIDDLAYGCAYFVRGTRNGVASALARHLENERLDARCREAAFDGMIELTATRGEVFVDAQVSKHGSVITMSDGQALNIAEDPPRVAGLDYRAAPSGHVILKLGAGKHEGRGRAPWERCLDALRTLG